MFNIDSSVKNSGRQPYFIYKRLELVAPIEFFLFSIELGFWYCLRRVHAVYPQIDSTGAVYYPRLFFSFVDRTGSRTPQNRPIPPELFATPGGTGVAIDGSGNLTATQPLGVKLESKAYPFRETIEIAVTGHNVASPPIVDIMLAGYLIPDSKREMWGINA